MSYEPIASYTLTVYSLQPESEELPPRWSGYLQEAAENLSDLLPKNMYVKITEPPKEDDGGPYYH